MDTSRVTRFEVINHGGTVQAVGNREAFGIILIAWDDGNTVELSLQDDGRTLKVFLGRRG